MTAPVIVSLPGTTNPTNTSPFSFTTTYTPAGGAGYILLLSIYNEHTGTAAATVTSVTSSGLTWALRKRSNSSTTGGLELWWAHGTGNLSSYSITVTFSGAYDDSCVLLSAVTGILNFSNPFDSNASLPAKASGPTATWTPSFTGISTSSSTDDLLLFVAGSVSGAITAGTGFTLVNNTANGGGGWTSVLGMASKAVTSFQSGATFTWGGALTNGFGSQTSGEAIFDALTSAPAANSVSFALTDAVEAAAFTLTESDRISFALTDAVETASFTLTEKDQFHFALTDAVETASFTLTKTDSLHFALTDAVETASFSLAKVESISFALTDAVETATFHLTDGKSLHFALTDAVETAHFALTGHPPIPQPGPQIAFPLRERTYRRRFVGVGYDPRFTVSKDRPGPLRIIEFIGEIKE